MQAAFLARVEVAVGEPVEREIFCREAALGVAQADISIIAKYNQEYGENWLALGQLLKENRPQTELKLFVERTAAFYWGLTREVKNPMRRFHDKVVALLYPARRSQATHTEGSDDDFPRSKRPRS